MGKGKAVLSGVHTEVSGKNFEAGLKHYYEDMKMPEKFITYLNENEKSRKSLWKNILNAAGLKRERLNSRVFEIQSSNTH